MSNDETNKAIEAVSAALHYQLAQAECREAQAQRNYAGVLLALRDIRKRAAELRSQYEPLAKLAKDPAVQAVILKAVRYVVFGHMEKP